MKILNRCRISKKLESHICRAGLYDSAMPIIKDDNVVGFVVPFAIEILEFIDANLQADLSIKQLCERFYITMLAYNEIDEHLYYFIFSASASIFSIKIPYPRVGSLTNT